MKKLKNDGMKEGWKNKGTSLNEFELFKTLRLNSFDCNNYFASFKTQFF